MVVTGLFDHLSQVIQKLYPRIQHVVTRPFSVKTLVGDAADSLVVATLLPLNANKLKYLSPESNRLVNECSLVRVDRRSFPNKIGFVLANELRSLEEFPEDEETWVYSEDDVALDERGRRERLEGSVAVEQHHENVPAEPNPCAVGLEVAAVWLRLRSAHCQVTLVLELEPTRVLRSRPWALHAA